MAYKPQKKIKKCLNCNCEFETFYNSQKYCSDRCSSNRYRKQNKDKILKYYREYIGEKCRISPEFKKKMLSRDNAKKKIIIPKDELCHFCQERFVEDRHHENYDEPLKVIFVCKKCHRWIHRHIGED